MKKTFIFHIYYPEGRHETKTVVSTRPGKATEKFYKSLSPEVQAGILDKTIRAFLWIEPDIGELKE